MGRDRKNEQHAGHWTRIERKTMEVPAWRALSPVAQALYVWLRFEWRGPNANNNGKLRLSVRQAAERMGVGQHTAARGFHDLQAKGFIVVSELPCLGTSGQARSTAFELTEIEMPGSDARGGRRLFNQWEPGRDFPVQRARANNPSGRNGKTKPHDHIDDRDVIILSTKPRGTSSK